jgi:L-cysteine S-thiosulfotransferase
MMKQTLLVLCAPLVLSACGSSMQAADYDKMTVDAMKKSFAARGIATMDRLNQDEAMKLCSEADTSGKPLAESLAKSIEASNMKSIKWPTDGKFLGDWKAGEKVAQSGVGLAWNNKADATNGGNCYNCHKISGTELSYGNLGPSLYNYGKLRGVTDPNAPASKAIVEYTWGKLWNSQAYTACSQMPRLGHNGVLTETQIQDIMALLLDPESPVSRS